MPAKTPGGMVSGVFQNTVTSFSAMQYAKALSPIVVTLFGMVMLASAML